MTAQPIQEHDPYDPVEIARVLPEKYHKLFFAEYTTAVDNARSPERYRQLRDLLRLWRLRAIAYSDPGYEDRLAVARVGHADDFGPAEEVIPGWPNR
jgi:Family of unknown function (DUF6247)